MELGLKVILSHGFDSNIYVIEGEKTVVIDTGLGFDPKIKEKIGEADIIINTHAHIDHCGGNNYFNAEILMHPDDIEEAMNGNFYGSAEVFKHSIKFEASPIPSKIEVGSLSLKSFIRQGIRQVVYAYMKKRKNSNIGRYAFPHGSFGRDDLGGNFGDLLNSLKKLSKIDFEWLLPGHGHPVNNGKEHAKLAYEVAKSLW